MKNFNLRPSNPWQFGKKYQTHSLPRRLFSKILAELPSQEILVLTGARQVGKTTLVFQVIDHLLNQKQTSPKKGFLL